MWPPWHASSGRLPGRSHRGCSCRQARRIPGSPGPLPLLPSFPAWDSLRDRRASRAGPAQPVVGGLAFRFPVEVTSHPFSLGLPAVQGTGAGQVHGI